MRNFILHVGFIVSSMIPLDLLSQENTAPAVKILEPPNKSKCNANSPVPYRIKVSDKEDGESAFGEIAANEVFLEVRYVPDASKVPSTHIADPAGLVSMKRSNCFTCHAFNGKLIAPSFYEIAQRYTPGPANSDLLAGHIREGSRGIWGTAAMPSHAELSNQQAQEIANWILKNGGDPDLNYYVGTEGVFKMKGQGASVPKGAFVLSATYADHGGLTSKDVVIIYPK